MVIVLERSDLNILDTRLIEIASVLSPINQAEWRLAKSNSFFSVCRFEADVSKPVFCETDYCSVF